MQGIRKKKSYIPEKNILSYRVLSVKPKNRMRVLIAMLFVFLALVISAGYTIFRAQFLKVEAIEVSGNRLLSHDEVIDAVVSRVEEDSKIARLLGRQHVWFWSLAQSKIEFSVPPELKKVSVDANMFLRRVNLLAEERVVVHIVCKTQDSACYGITGDGVVFAQIPEVKGSLILRIEDTGPESVTVGSPYFGNADFLKRVYATTVILESNGFTPTLIRVKDHSLNEWEALLPSGMTMYFSGMFVPKNLPLVLDELKKRGGITTYQYADFRVEDKVFYQ